MIMRLPPKQPANTRPATGDARLNKVLSGHAKSITVNLKLAEKVGQKLGKMAKTDPRRAASLVARMISLEVQGKIKIDEKTFHGLPSNSKAALYNPALIELNEHSPKIAREFNLPGDPIVLMR